MSLMENAFNILSGVLLNEVLSYIFLYCWAIWAIIPVYKFFLSFNSDAPIEIRPAEVFLPLFFGLFYFSVAATNMSVISALSFIFVRLAKSLIFTFAALFALGEILVAIDRVKEVAKKEKK